MAIKEHPITRDQVINERTHQYDDVNGEPRGMAPTKTLVANLPFDRLADPMASGWSRILQEASYMPRAAIEIPSRIQRFARQLEGGDTTAMQVDTFVNGHVLSEDDSRAAQAARAIAKGLIYDSVVVKGVSIAETLTPEKGTEVEDYIREAVAAYPQEASGRTIINSNGEEVVLRVSSNEPGMRVAASMIIWEFKDVFQEPNLAERTAYNARLVGGALAETAGKVAAPVLRRLASTNN